MMQRENEIWRGQLLKSCVQEEKQMFDCINMLLSHYHVFIAIPAYTIGHLTHLEFSCLTLSPNSNAVLSQK